MLSTTVIFREGDGGLGTIDMTLDICKRLDTGVDIASATWGVVDLTEGAYTLTIPEATVPVFFKISLNGTIPLVAVVGTIGDLAAEVSASVYQTLVDAVTTKEQVAIEVQMVLDEQHGRAPWTTGE